MNRLHIAHPSISHTMAGQVGEYIAAASILQQGWGVAIATQDSVDLVAWNKQTGQKVTIQVKSCQLSKSSRNSLQFQLGLGGVKDRSGTKRKRLPNEMDFDILALVSSEQRACYFMPVTAIKQYKMNKPPSFFDKPYLESDSWEETIRILNDGR